MHEELLSIASRVFGLPRESVTLALARSETAAWDSFNHLLFVSEVERAFEVHFTIADIESIRTLGDVDKLLS